MDRRTLALQQQEASISEETANLAAQNEQLAVQLEALRIEKTRLEASQVTHEAEWDAVLTTNVKGMFTVVKQAIPHLKAAGGGTIINLATSAAMRWARVATEES